MLDGRLERALELWNEGVGVTEIARAIGHGATPDAVIGKARRAHWPAHPHPPLGMETRAALKAADPRTARNTEAQRERRAAQRAQKRNEWGETPMVVACEPQRLAVPTPRFSVCQWISGDGRPWRKCEAPTEGGSSYCAEHHRRARERRPHAGAAEHGVRW
jgi:hypothetical protein